MLRSISYYHTTKGPIRMHLLGPRKLRIEKQSVRINWITSHLTHTRTERRNKDTQMNKIESKSKPIEHSALWEGLICPLRFRWGPTTMTRVQAIKPTGRDRTHHSDLQKSLECQLNSLESECCKEWTSFGMEPLEFRLSCFLFVSCSRSISISIWFWFSWTWASSSSMSLKPRSKSEQSFNLD